MRPTDPRLLRQLAPARGRLAGVVAGGVGSGLLVLAQAWAVAGLLVAVVRRQELAPWAAFVLAVVALRALTGWLTDVLATSAAAEVGHDLRRRLTDALLRRVASAAPARSTGEVSALATRGVAAAEPWFTRYLPALVVAGVLPPLTVAAIATQDLLSAVLVLATLPLVPVFGALVGLATRDRAQQQWRAMASLSGHFVDVMRGLPTLVVHRRARAQSRSIAAITDRYRQATLRTLRIAFLSAAVLELVATLSVALVAVVVGTRLASGALDLHTALVVLLLAPEAYWPLRRVGAEFHASAEGGETFAAVEAFGEEPGTRGETTRVVPAGAALMVRDLTVTHPGRQVPALTRLSCRIPARGVTLVAGPSGCGKSTLLATLAGLLPVRAGSVTLGGLPVGGSAWRRRVALLPQRPVFVAGTVADNLRLGGPGATDAELWAVLRRVALAERVRSLPDGLDTDLAEDGANLSAGERARLALARVVLSDRPWILLDEPTAHLDDLTGRIILDTVAELGRDRAVVLVAHRAGTEAVADTVVRLPAPVPGAVPTHPPGAGAPAPVAPPPAGDVALPRAGMAGSVVLGGLASASGVALTATAGWLIVQASTRPAILTLMVAIVGVRAFGLARPVLRYAERLRSHDVALRLLARRRVQVYDALVDLVPGRLGRRRGDVLASVVDDVDGVVDEQLRVRLPVRSFAVVLVLAAAAAAVVLPVAALSVTLTAGFAASAAYTLARLGAARAEAGAVRLRAELSAEVLEVVQTAPELTMWQAGDRAAARVVAASRRMGRAQLAGARWLASARALALLLAGLGVVATAAVTGPYVGAGVSAPMAALLVLLPLAFAEVTAPLAEAGALAARTSAAARRLEELEATRPLVRDDGTGTAPSDSQVELTDVTGGYGDAPALRGITVSLVPGRRLGVVGASGSGKSTLAGMLLRFLDPAEGEVTVGATPARDLRLEELRRVVGLVDDDPHVFASTLRENLRLARPTASDTEIAGALLQASLGRWLAALPDGLDTWLGDGHGQVSGGERARLGVARVLLSGQRILVLDEPVAHLDHATAGEVATEVLGRSASDDRRSIVWITHSEVGLDQVDDVVHLPARHQARRGPQRSDAQQPSATGTGSQNWKSRQVTTPSTATPAGAPNAISSGTSTLSTTPRPPGEIGTSESSMTNP